jgi:hypothetical protein
MLIQIVCSRTNRFYGAHPDVNCSAGAIAQLNASARLTVVIRRLPLPVGLDYWITPGGGLVGWDHR